MAWRWEIVIGLMLRSDKNYTSPIQVNLLTVSPIATGRQKGCPEERKVLNELNVRSDGKNKSGTT